MRDKRCESGAASVVLVLASSKRYMHIFPQGKLFLHYRDVNMSIHYIPVQNVLQYPVT